MVLQKHKSLEELVKQFKKGIFGRYNGDTLKVDLSASLNNFNNYWTKCSLKDFVKKDETTGSTTATECKLNFVIPKNNYGLLFIYCTNGSSNIKGKSGVYLKYPNIDNPLKPVIFNNNNAWWDGFETGQNCYLKYGINVIKLNGDASDNKAYSFNLGGYSADTSDIVLIGQLDLVDSRENDGIDLNRIPYIAVDSTTASKQILKDINIIDPDHSFYYNCLMDNSTAIDFNDNLDESEKETLLTPTIWYDYNNINNKFVITEISDTDMKKGITIARTSKR